MSPSSRSSSRARRSLLAIADDTGAHVNAVNFVRIIAETTAAVLVTLAFTFFIDNIWLVLLYAALIMTAVSFVLVGASPRSVGRAHAASVLRLTAPLVHFLRVLLGPLANALVVARQPGDARAHPLRGRLERGAAAQHGRRGHRARRARGGRPRAHPLDLRVQRHRGARGHGAAHRHGHDRRRGAPAAGDGAVPEGRLLADPGHRA